MHSLWSRAVAAVVALACFVAFTSCMSSTSVTQQPPQTTYEKVQAALARGAPIDEIIRLGDDDMPDKASAGPVTAHHQCEVTGVPGYRLIGCDSFGECMYEWQDMCGQTYYEFTDTDGKRSHWAEPFDCRGCRP